MIVTSCDQSAFYKKIRIRVIKKIFLIGEEKTIKEQRDSNRKYEEHRILIFLEIKICLPATFIGGGHTLLCLIVGEGLLARGVRKF